MVYVIGVDDSLDMEGFIIRLHARDGYTTEVAFEDSEWATVRYEIDFTIPGEYEVFFYWGDINFGSMAIQVIATD